MEARATNGARAIARREAASGRVRRLTGAALAAAAALTGVFTTVAAGSTHARKLVSRSERHRVVSRPGVHVTAPPPPLVAIQQQPTAPPPAVAPAPAPDVTPVVTSGGS